MIRQTSHVRRWALTGAAAWALSLAAGQAYAADAAADSGLVEELVVTGSRIPRPNLESATPTVAISAEKIQTTGAQEVGSVLRSLPSAGVSFATPQTSASLVTTGFGLSTFNLRNLNENRTLVLVDGRRFVSGSEAGNFVDLNAIPVEMIDRIDVVTGGASAIYGSDALAGVVNIITKHDFEGLVFTAQGGRGTYGDGENYKVTATGGSSFADDRGAAVLSLTWSRDNGAFARNRDFLAVDSIAASALGVADSSDITTVISPFLSSFSEKGRINLTDGTTRLVVDDDGVVKPFSTARDGFNRQAFRAISAPVERLGAAANIDYKITDWLKWYGQVSYSSTRARNEGEAFPLDSDNIYGGNAPGNQPQCAPVGVTVQCQFGIPLTSALIPEAIKQAERALEPGVPDENLVVGFSRRMTEIGTRDGEALRQTYRVVTGFSGDLPYGFTFDTSLDYGRTTSNQHSGGQLNVINTRFALDAEVGPGGVLQCRDATARLQGCVPLDIFGRGKISEAAANYVRVDSARDAQIEQVVLNGYLEGPVFTLPAGPAKIVLGGEYRHEKLEDVPDSLTQTGLNASNITPPTFGAFDVREAFAELRIPVFKDLAWAKSLDVDLSGRISNYSTVGDTKAYAANLEWQPIDEIRFRAQAAHAVRAPTIFELFSPGQQNFPTVNDPCQGVTRSGAQAAFLNDVTDAGSGVDAATVGDPVATRCLADPNIAARVTSKGSLVLTQQEIQGVSGFNSGNPDLQEETSNSYTLGLVLRPDWTDWLRPALLSVDWYRINIDGGIGTFGTQLTVDRCYQTGSPVFCNQVVRNGTGAFQGSLGFVNQTNLNLAKITTQGLDVQFNYLLDLNDGPIVRGLPGELGLDVLYSHLYDLTITPFPGADPIKQAGVLGAASDRATVDLTYHYGPLHLSWDARIIGAVTADNFPGSHIGAQSFHDVQARYDLTKRLSVTAGVDNLFNHYVFIGGTSAEVSSTVIGTTIGQRTEAVSYDGLGRRYYFALRFQL